MELLEMQEALSRCDFFQGLNSSDLERIAGICKHRELSEGETVFQQGDYGEHLFVIVSGQASLERSVNLGNRKGSVTIEALGKGRILGCWSTLLGEPHILMSSAVCQKPTTVLEMKGAELRQIMMENQSFGFRIMERFCYLLRDRIQAAYGAMEKI